MSRQVNKWLVKGRKNCKKGNHWWIMDFGDYCLCPVCGIEIKTKELTLDGTILLPFNAYLVNEMSLVHSEGKETD